MKIRVDTNLCSGQARCNATAPKVFHLNDEGYNDSDDTDVADHDLADASPRSPRLSRGRDHAGRRRRRSGQRGRTAPIRRARRALTDAAERGPMGSQARLPLGVASQPPRCVGFLQRHVNLPWSPGVFFPWQ